MGLTAQLPQIQDQQVKDVTLALFGGRKTDMSPSDVPEGLSFDTEDGIYLPGDWISRPGLARLYAGGALPAGTSVLYEKTFIQPNDDPLTLALTSDGKLWAEDVGNSPLNPAQIGSVPAGLYAQSVSAFGREYIAFSDLLHGQGVPLQYDGTNLDRLTMDGPGASPQVANFQPASATLAGSAVHVNIAVSPGGIVFGGLTTIPIGPNGKYGTFSYYAYFTVTTTTNHNLAEGNYVTIAGSTSTPAVNQSWQVASTPSATTFTVNGIFYPTGSVANGGGGTVTVSANALLRVANVVTATTSAAHGFIPGWQVQISGIANNAIGGGISAIARDGNGVVTVTTASAHGLPVGATIAITGVTAPDASFNGTFAVATVVSPTQFTYLQGGTVESSGAPGGGANVQDVWSTTAFIQSTPSATTFTYAQLGPNDNSSGSGTATIIGQVSPGEHQLCMMWLTRQGYLSAPSPPIQFVANGGQQLQLTEIGLGPNNVVARVFGITGAGGDNFFTLVATPQVAGQVTGTALIILDNSSTDTILDFADNTILAGIPIDQVGNDLFDQVVLGPVLGCFSFASRLAVWGDYNKVENFVNMGFCGGFLSGTRLPLGWTNSGAGAGGLLEQGGSWASGWVWQFTGDGSGNKKGLLSQSAFQDVFGDAIISPNTQYAVRIWAKQGSGAQAGHVFFTLTSASTGFSAIAQFSIAGFGAGGSMTALVQLSQVTPAVIPPDLLLNVYEIGLGNTDQCSISEIEFIFTDNPYRDNLSRWSYVLNPEAFAETTGELGPEDDESPIRCFALLRQDSLLETAEGVHIFTDTTAEPDEWNVAQVTRSAGALSLKAGDPGKFGTGDAAEDFAVVASKNGAYLFAGSRFWKVSQEISRNPDTTQAQDPRKCWEDINWAAEQTIVAKNDPGNRRAYFAVPLNGATTPNVIFVLDYHEMDTAEQIASAAPMHITLAGKMRSSDLTRKWSVWNIAANDLEVLVRPGNQRALFLAGGAFPGGSAHGNIYSLDPTKLTDDDYGQISPYYTTYFFTDHEQEQALDIGSDNKLVKHVHAFVSGVGLVYITPIVNSQFNFFPNLSPRLLVADTTAGTFLASDLEWTTVGLRGSRIAFRVAVQPLPGATDVKLRLQKFIVGMMRDPVAQFRQSGV